MTNSIPPFTPPAVIRARLRNATDTATLGLARSCATAIDLTSEPIIIVPIANDTPSESVNAVMSALADAGYHVTRRSACNDTGLSEIVISIEVL
jgi:hypothetical protein